MLGFFILNCAELNDNQIKYYVIQSNNIQDIQVKNILQDNKNIKNQILFSPYMHFIKKKFPALNSTFLKFTGSSIL